MPEPSPTTVSTLLKLYAPKEVGITLVPLQEVEQAEDSAVWSSFFLMTLFLFLGSLLPLLLTDYSNNPVMIILAVMVIFFAALSIIFHVKTRNLRNTMRKNAVGPAKEVSSEEKKTKNNDDAQAYRGTMLFFYSLHKHIFKGAPALPKDLFLKRVPDMFEDASAIKDNNEIFDELQKLGFIEAFETDSGKLYVRQSLEVLESMGLKDVKIQKT